MIFFFFWPEDVCYKSMGLLRLDCSRQWFKYACYGASLCFSKDLLVFTPGSRPVFGPDITKWCMLTDLYYRAAKNKVVKFDTKQDMRENTLCVSIMVRWIRVFFKNKIPSFETCHYSSSTEPQRDACQSAQISGTFFLHFWPRNKNRSFAHKSVIDADQEQCEILWYLNCQWIMATNITVKE